jgi:hypothetical protein
LLLLLLLHRMSKREPTCRRMTRTPFCLCFAGRLLADDWRVSVFPHAQQQVSATLNILLPVL